MKNIGSILDDIIPITPSDKLPDGWSKREVENEDGSLHTIYSKKAETYLCL